MRRKAASILAAAGLATAAFIAARAALGSAASSVTVTGSSRQITTDPAAQIDPTISGNVVAYTDYRTGSAEVWYNDITGGPDHQATTATSLTWQIAGDISGSTIVYTELTAGGTTDVKAFTTGGGVTDVAEHDLQ